MRSGVGEMDRARSHHRSRFDRNAALGRPSVARAESVSRICSQRRFSLGSVFRKELAAGCGSDGKISQRSNGFCGCHVGCVGRRVGNRLGFHSGSPRVFDIQNESKSRLPDRPLIRRTNQLPRHLLVSRLPDPRAVSIGLLYPLWPARWGRIHLKKIQKPNIEIRTHWGHYSPRGSFRILRILVI